MKNEKYLRYLWWLSLLLCILFNGQAYAATYPVANAEQGRWQQEFMAFGQVTARAESMIMLPFSLKITEVRVEPNQLVTAGTRLLHFHSPELQKDLSDYSNRRKLTIVAEKQQKIIRKGAKEHTLTRREVIGAEESVVQYKAELERSWDKLQTDLMLLNNDMKQMDLDTLLDKTTPQDAADILGELQAPFSGIVINRPPQVGIWMQPDTPLFELEDLHQVYVSVTVPEKELSNWLNGETVIEKENTIFKLKRLAGKPGIDIHSGMRQLLFHTDNPEILLRDGQWLQVMHRSPARPVVWIPETAVVSRNNKTWCIIAQDQKYTPQQIEVGDASKGKVPVLSGLTSGQQVVRENGYELLYRDLKELIQFVD